MGTLILYASFIVNRRFVVLLFKDIMYLFHSPFLRGSVVLYILLVFLTLSLSLINTVPVLTLARAAGT